MRLLREVSPFSGGSSNEGDPKVPASRSVTFDRWQNAYMPSQKISLAAHCGSDGISRLVLRRPRRSTATAASATAAPSRAPRSQTSPPSFCRAETYASVRNGLSCSVMPSWLTAAFCPARSAKNCLLIGQLLALELKIVHHGIAEELCRPIQHRPLAVFARERIRAANAAVESGHARPQVLREAHKAQQLFTGIQILRLARQLIHAEIDAGNLRRAGQARRLHAGRPILPPAAGEKAVVANQPHDAIERALGGAQAVAASQSHAKPVQPFQDVADGVRQRHIVVLQVGVVEPAVTALHAQGVVGDA